jgi:hypothetical protein
MRNLYQTAQVDEIKQRLLQLRPESQRLWGKMNPAQALAHCSAGLEMTLGQVRPSRLLIGRIIGPVIKPIVFRDQEPMRRNVPTAKELVVDGECDFQGERDRLSRSLHQPSTLLLWPPHIR